MILPSFGGAGSNVVRGLHLQSRSTTSCDFELPLCHNGTLAEKAQRISESLLWIRKHAC